MVTNTKQNYSKLHHKIVHALPFVPSRKRQKGFEITRHYGNWSLTLKAWETLNYYDLITLLLMVRKYIERDFEVKGKHDGRKLIAMKFDLTTLTKERELSNQFNNRKTLAKSFLRFKRVDLEFRYPDGSMVSSWLVYEVKADEKSWKTVEVLMNERFLEYCVDAGILLNWKRLSKYKDNGVAVILDAYLQGVKQRKGKSWKYRDWIDEKTVFKLIDPNSSQKSHHLKEQAKEAFSLMHDNGLPFYRYNNVYKRWEREVQTVSEV